MSEFDGFVGVELELAFIKYFVRVNPGNKELPPDKIEEKVIEQYREGKE